MAFRYDPIMDALLAYLKLQTQFGTINSIFQTMQRGMIMWEELSALQQGNPIMARQPALMLYDGVGLGGGMIDYKSTARATAPIRTITRTIILYARAPAPINLPGGMAGGKYLMPRGGGVIFHPLIEAVENALLTIDNPETGTLTLGGLVAYCRLEGRGRIFPPDIDDNGQGMATLPVEIRIP